VANGYLEITGAGVFPSPDGNLEEAEAEGAAG